MLGKNRLTCYLLAFQMPSQVGVTAIDMLIKFSGILSLGRMHSFQTIPSYIYYKDIFLLPLRNHSIWNTDIV